MTLVSPEKLFAKFKANPPASCDSVTQCQSHLSFRLPADYVQFLKRMNGGEGFVGKNYLMAWPVEDLVQFNKELFVDVAAPDLFLFGSSGGGEEFAFDARSSPPLIVAVPSIVSLEDAITIAQDFNSFLQHLYQSESLFSSQSAN
jgi:SMI1 / KNR4 family (SUKH-1)